MENRRVRCGFTVLEVVVVLLVLGVFAFAVIPASRKAREKKELKDTLAQATQLWSVIMAANTEPRGTGKQSVAIWPTNTFRSSTEYFVKCLATNRVPTNVSLSLLAAPGVPVWTGAFDRLTGSNVAWSVIRWDGVLSSNDPPFLLSRNLIARNGSASLMDVDKMSSAIKPFGDETAIIVTARGNLRLAERFRTNDNFQIFLNPYADTNEVLRPDPPKKR
jgi:prepilin-type N-terminal cleavage/methylation domain-containing protein